MKYIIFTIHLFLLFSGISAVAKQEKIIKKPLGLKPIKESKTILEEFRQHLTAEDAEFIKQIDKQFKLHGDKLKIKVEKDNATRTMNKNQKRTVDESLAYPYQQGMHQSGYYFSRPIYMHKFTSRDLPTERGYEKATEIEVQQSHSYEIKPENIQYEGKNQQQQVYEDPVPVIVLKVPGPSKYSLHLQALLQQYLELRAAQFLKVLEEQDRQGQLMSPQHYVAPQEHVAYVPMIAITPMYQNYYHHQPQQQQAHVYRQQQQQQQSYYHHQQQLMHQHQVYHQQHQQQHIQNGQQSYYRRPQVHNHHQQHHHQPQVQVQQVHYPKYVPQQQPAPPQHPSYQHTVQQQPIHTTTFVTYVTPAYPQETHEHPESLPTSENYPSDKHTHVIFKKKKTRVQHHPQVQPSITYHTDEPIVVPEQQQASVVHYTHPEPEEVYVSHPEEYPVTHQPTYSNHRKEHKEIQYVASATERSKNPYNYHVASTLAPTDEELQERHNPKRMAPFSKEQFEKAKRMMETKSKRNRGSVRVEGGSQEEKSEKKMS